MNCACPAAYGGPSTGRRPALFSSPKRSTAWGYGYAGISTPGPAYANGAVHPPTPYGAWRAGWAPGPYSGPMGDAASDANQAQAAASISWQQAQATTKPTFGEKFQTGLDTALGIFKEVAPVVFGPRAGRGGTAPAAPSYQPPARAAGGIPPVILYGSVAVAAVVTIAVVGKWLARRRGR